MSSHYVEGLEDTTTLFRGARSCSLVQRPIKLSHLHMVVLLCFPYQVGFFLRRELPLLPWSIIRALIIP